MRVVITGANRGIGLGLARVYAERGDEVWATARKPAEAKELQALAKSSGGRVHVQEVDVQKSEQVKALATALGDTPVDVVINNAGIASPWNAGLADFDEAEAMRCFDTNALGAIRITRALLENLRGTHGKVVNMTSRMGSIGDNGSGRAYAYRMAKAALNMATRNIAYEVKPFGGIAIALHPGWVKTSMGGGGATEDVSETAGRIVKRIDALKAEDSGRFWHAKGEELPW